MRRLDCAFNFGAILRVFFSTMLLWMGHGFAPVSAHQTGESYIYLGVSETAITGRYEIPLVDLQLIFDMDSDGDGVVDPSEYAPKNDEIIAHFQDRLEFQIGAETTKVEFTGYEFFPETNEWVMLNFNVPTQGAAIPETINIRHRSSWDDADPNHTVLLLIESNSRTGVTENEAQHSLIFARGDETVELSLVGASPFVAFSKFIWHGIHHLLIGFDHIAFILALVLPSVLVAQQGKWVPAQNFKTAAWNIIKIATVFTIAHSITLTLAALGIVRLPAAPVEALIAISIVGAAAANIFSVGRRWVYPLIFLLGLLHGLGFANVLAPLALEPINMLPSLLGFNIGVEIGQIGILLPPFILLFLLRNWSGYQTVILKGGSALLIAVAIYWFAERALGMAVLVFGSA